MSASPIITMQRKVLAAAPIFVQVITASGSFRLRRQRTSMKTKAMMGPEVASFLKTTPIILAGEVFSRMPEMAA